MALYKLWVILTCMMEILDGHKVPVLTVCSSICSVKQDGSFSTVTCHSQTPNTFRVYDLTPLLTGREMIYIINKEGINSAHCVKAKKAKKAAKKAKMKAKKTQGGDKKGFLAKRVYITADTGVFVSLVKKRKWTSVTQDKLLHLCGDPVSRRVLGVLQNSIISIKGFNRSVFLNCESFTSGIKYFDYDVNTKEAFIVNTSNTIFRMARALPKLSTISEIRGFKLDQKKRKIYILKKEETTISLVALSYEGTLVEEFRQEQQPLKLMGHFDKFANGVLVQYLGSQSFYYMPGRIKSIIRVDKVADIDYDDTSIYILEHHGKVKQKARGNKFQRHFSKPPSVVIGYSIAVV